ncbi:hypothetical protein Vretimale_19686, partial [Volvox reticuliferus]
NNSPDMVHLRSSGSAAFPAPVGNGLRASNSSNLSTAIDAAAIVADAVAVNAVFATALPTITAAAVDSSPAININGSCGGNAGACSVTDGSSEVNTAQRPDSGSKPTTQAEVWSPLISRVGVGAAAPDLTGIALATDKASLESPSRAAAGMDPLAVVSRVAWAAPVTAAAEQRTESPAAPSSPAAQPIRWRRWSQGDQAYAELRQQGLSCEPSRLRSLPSAQRHEAR